MYGQYQNSESAARWIFWGFVTIIVMAGLLGSNLKEAKWLNPEIAAAEASLINIEAAHQSATYELQERLSTAQTEAEIQAIQREQNLLDAQYQHDIQALGQDLAHKDLAFRTAMTALTIIVGAFAFTLAAASIIWVITRAVVYIRSIPSKEEPMRKSIPVIEKRIPNVAERAPYDALDRNQILFANRLDERMREITAEREESELLAARLKALSNREKMSSEEYKKRPLAG